MLEQVVIVVCGVISVFTSQDRRASIQRWACIFGLCAAPFWVCATWRAEQWGMLVLALFYAAGWVFGVWNYWIRAGGIDGRD